MRSFPSDIRREGPCFLALILLTCAAYWQIQHAQFVNFDDTLYVTEAPQVQQGITLDGIRWAFTTFDAANWHPLTWLSLMLDYQILGLNPGGFHRTNLLLHVFSALLLFHFLYRTTGSLGKSFWVAALFAVHPLHVESVAWIAERKDVLSGFFFMLTLLAYLGYAEKPGIRSYCWVFTAFAAGLMAKPMLVTLPCLLLLLDYWPLNRFKTEEPGAGAFWRLGTRFAIEKIPLFGLTILSSVITIVAQHNSGSVVSLERIPFEFRIANTPLAYVAYLSKTLWPQDLAVYYPYPETMSILMITGAVLLLLAITLPALLGSRRVPFVIVGWLWYLGMLVPVIGILQTGMQVTADRYTYLPIIGLFIAVAWGGGALITRLRIPGVFLNLIATAIVVAMAVLTAHQVRYWNDSIALFRHATQVLPRNDLAHYNLGCALLEKNDLDEAEAQFREAVRIKPQYADALSNLAFTLSQKEEYDEALVYYQKALNLEPDKINTACNMAVTLQRIGKNDEARKVYRDSLAFRPNDVVLLKSYGKFLMGQGDLDTAIQVFMKIITLDPGNDDAHNDLGTLFARKGDFDQSTAEFKKARQCNPNNIDAGLNLGINWIRQGRFEEAIAEFSRLFEANPESLKVRHQLANAHTNFAITLASDNRLDEARQHLEHALELKSDSLEARFNLANALLRQGKNEEAAAQFTEVVRAKPDDADAHYGLGIALIGLGKNQEATGHFAEVLRLKPDHPDVQNQLDILRKNGTS